MGHYISTSELPPSVSAALESVGYGRKDIEVKVQEKISLSPTSGDGFKGFVVACKLDGSREFSTTWGSWGGTNMFTKTVDDAYQLIDVPANMGFLVGRIGGGRPTYASLVVGPANMNPTLLPPQSELTEKERWALGVFKTYKSSYRKEKLRERGVTAEEIKSLADRGFLKIAKNGATSITTEGKNNAARVF